MTLRSCARTFIAGPTMSIIESLLVIWRMVVKNSGKWRVLCFLFLFLACVLFSLFCSGAYAICERRQRPGAGRAAGREGQGARAGSEAEARSGIE